MTLKSNPQHPVWFERHRPTCLEEYVFNSEAHKQSFLEIIAKNLPQHVLLEGVQGSGKTSIAKIIIDKLIDDENDVLVIDASRENGVDVIREKIMNFVRTMSMGDYKVVLLEEADYISPQAQGALRQMMEVYAAHARFILTCNYVNRIIDPIKSRCARFTFGKPNMDDVMIRVAEILAVEKVKFTEKCLAKYVSAYYPDIRAIINQVQAGVSADRLPLPPESGSRAPGWRFGLQVLLAGGDWGAARKLICASCAGDEYVGVYRFLYDNLHTFGRFSNPKKYDSGIEILAEGVYRHSITSDPEITMAGVIVQLSMV